jgi:hypothetical protein
MGVGGFELPDIFLKHAAIRRKVLCYAVCPSTLFRTFICSDVIFRNKKGQTKDRI